MLKQKQKSPLLLMVQLVLIFVVAALLFVVSRANREVSAAAGINETVNFQGRLLTSAGAVVPDGSYNMEFKIYSGGDGDLGGSDETLEWTETRESGNKVVVKNGYFSVYLGSVTSFGSSVDWNEDTLWLSINIGGTGAASYDGEMDPFTRLSSTPYALNSKALGGLEAANFVQLAQGVQTDSSTSNASIAINKTGGTADILQLQRGGTDVLTLDNTGYLTVQNTSDSTTALQVLDADGGDPVLNIDTTNERVGIGTNAPTAELEVAGGIIAQNKIQVGTGSTLDQCATIFGNIDCEASLELAVSLTDPSVLSYSTYNNHSVTINGNNSNTNTANHNSLGLLSDAGSSFSGQQTAVNAEIVSLANITTAVAVDAQIRTFGNTITTATVLQGALSAGGGEITTGHGLRIASATAGGTLTTNYGVKIETQTVGTNNYGLVLGDTSTNTLWINDTNDSTDEAGGIVFGYSKDTNLYRSAADTLQTDDAFNVQNTSATALNIQSASAGETVLTVDTAARSGSGGNRVKIGNSTGTDTALTILQLDSATADPTSNLSALSGGLFYDSTTNKVKIIEDGTVKTLCNTTDAGCGSGGGGYATVQDEASGLTARTTINFTGGGISCADNGGSSRTDCTVDFISGDGSGSTSSGSGLEEGTGGFGLLQGCSDGQTLKWDDASAEWECGSDRATYSHVLTGDYSNTTTLEDVDDDATGTSKLGFPVGANEDWVFIMNVQHNSAAAADSRWQLNAPTGATCQFSAWIHGQSDADVGCNTVTASLPTLGQEDLARMSGSVQTGGTSGNVQLQFRQNAASGTSYIRAGSFVLAWRVDGADLAEIYYAKDPSVTPGTVVAMDPSLPAGVRPTSGAYDSKTVGVISTKPGSVLGSGADAGNGGAPVPLALSGRVPVKVTTENGPINPGDLLTASSTPGVAMRASKAGPVIGQAMTSYDGEGVGEVTVFIKTSYSNGLGSAELAGNITPDNPDYNKAVLSQLMTDSTKLSGVSDLSEIVTDRVVAGLEVITPKVVADNVSTNSLTVNDETGLAFEDTNGEQIGSFDENGNLIIKGTLTADKIKANQIEGLEVIAKKLISSNSETQAQNIDTNPDLSSLDSTTELTIAKGIVETDFRINGTLFADGQLRVGGPAEFYGETIFHRLVSFVEQVVFNNDVAFKGQVTFNNDAGGFAVVKSGESSVEVKFSQEYKDTPVVTINTSDGQFVDYAYKDLTSEGFTIVLKTPANKDTSFAWTAISVNNAVTTTQ